MVLDREARDIAVPLVCGLRDGELTNDDFESRWPIASQDRALRAVSATLWGAYSDNYTHTIDDLTEYGRAFFDRCALFLASGLEYEWPTDRFYADKSIPAWALVASLGLLLPFYVRLRRRFHEQEAAGESDVWPFMRRADYERERSRMPLGENQHSNRNAVTLPPEARSEVVATLHNRDADRCVKIIKQPDGTFGFQEFRREPEDAGSWSLVNDSPTANLATREQALDAACADVAWLRDRVSGSRFQGPGTNHPVKPAP